MLVEQVGEPLVRSVKYLLGEVACIFGVGNHGANHTVNAVMVAVIEQVKIGNITCLEALNQVGVGRFVYTWGK